MCILPNAEKMRNAVVVDHNQIQPTSMPEMLRQHYRDRGERTIAEVEAESVYFTLNPLNRDLLARRCNRVDAADQGETACDADVLRRRWLLIDADPTRISGVSSTDEEKARAWDLIHKVRDHLGALGWPD